MLSNDWELQFVYQQNFLVAKKTGNSFLAKAFPSFFAVNAR